MRAPYEMNPPVRTIGPKPPRDWRQPLTEAEAEEWETLQDIAARVWPDDWAMEWYPSPSGKAPRGRAVRRLHADHYSDTTDGEICNAR